MEQLDQNKKRENLQKEKNQIFRLLPRVDDLMKKENVQRLAEKEGYERDSRSSQRFCGESEK